MYLSKVTAVFAVLVGLLLSGCASTSELRAPCPDFGKHCNERPVNGWTW